MKFNFRLHNKPASVEADVERIAEKWLDNKAKKPTRYQIKQEEKRKNKEQENKHKMQYLYIMLGLLGVCFAISFIAPLLGG